MLPPRAITGAACRTARKTDPMFRSSSWRKPSRSCSSSGLKPPPPTVGTTISRRPARACATSTALQTSSSCSASPGQRLTCPPGTASSKVWRTACSASSRRPINTTAAPSASRARAHAAPIPPAPPVTRAVLPCKAFTVVISHPYCLLALSIPSVTRNTHPPQCALTPRHGGVSYAAS